MALIPMTTLSKTGITKRLLPRWAAAFLRCAPLAALAPLPVHAEAPANPQLAQAITALRAITTLRADFVQTDANGGQVKGVLWLKRPGKIRFQYAPGYPMTILSDGHALFMIDKEVNQTQRWPIGNSPLGALLDPSKDVARFGRLVPTGDPAIVAVEVRDRTHPEYGITTLAFRQKGSAPGGLELEGWYTQDAQNRGTRIRLSNQQYGVNPSEDLFRFTDTRARPHK